MLRKCVLLSLVGLATTAITALGTPMCPDGKSMSTFLAPGYSCQIGDMLFSKFSYTPSGTTALQIKANQVIVDTVGPYGTGASIYGTDIGLQFDAPWDATQGKSTDAAIRFTVTILGGSYGIEDFGLAQTSGVTKNGYAGVAESGCGPAPCNPVGGAINLLTFDAGGSNRETENETFFSTHGSVEVEKDISASGGTKGTASISVVQDTFCQIAVPEPLSMGLIGGGLALLGVARLRRRRTA